MLNLEEFAADVEARTKLELMAQQVENDSLAKIRFEARVADIGKMIEASSARVVAWMVENEDRLGVTHPNTTTEGRGFIFRTRLDTRFVDVNKLGDPILPEIEEGEYTVVLDTEWHEKDERGRLQKLDPPRRIVEIHLRSGKTRCYSSVEGLHKLAVLSFLLSEVTPRDFEPHKKSIRDLYETLPYEERLAVLREFTREGVV